MLLPAFLSRRNPAATAPDAGNAFIPITLAWRRALLAYFAVYLVATPLLQEAALPSGTPLVKTRLAMWMAVQALTFLPILFYRPSYGWLHPLIFPTLFHLASDVVRRPGELLGPLAIGRAPRESALRIDLLPQYTEEVVARGEVKLLAVRTVALLAYYAGFFLLARGRGALPARWMAARPRPGRVRAVAGAVALAALLWVAFYLAQRGGLQAHLVEYWMRRNRSASTIGANAAHQVVGIGVVALMLWYALEPGIPRNPLFAAATAVMVALLFLISGSRSALFFAVVLFVALWMLRHRTIPAAPVVVLGALALVLLGPMGEFRRSVKKTGEVDWRVLADFRGAVSRTTGEAAQRAARAGGVPVMIRVPHEVGFLRGRSYLNGVLFFVPRAAWKGKPKGAASHNAALIFGGHRSSLPIPPEAEVYWNFSLAGVIAVFLLFGAFHHWLAAVFAAGGHDPALWVPYVLALFYLVPSSMRLTVGARLLCASLLMLAAMGAWRRRGPAASAAAADG